MISEEYEGYTIHAAPVGKGPEKWAVSVIISKKLDGITRSRKYTADDGICYILEIEAAKECLNLGRNLIKSGRLDF